MNGASLARIGVGGDTGAGAVVVAVVVVIADAATDVSDLTTRRSTHPPAAAQAAAARAVTAGTPSHPTVVKATGRRRGHGPGLQ